MKQKNLAVIIVAGFMSAVFAFLISSLLIATPSNRKQKAEVVEPITSNFPDVDKKYFNDKSVNPTQLIRIGESTNESPFNKD